MAAAALASIVALAVVWALDDGGIATPGHAGVTPRVVVDPESRGGQCDDLRDAATASSPTTPWCTFERVLQGEAVGTVLLRSAAYAGLTVTDRIAGEPPLAIRPFPGDVVRVSTIAVAGAAPLAISGLEVEGNVVVGAAARDVVIEGCKIGNGVDLEEGSADVRIVGNDITAPTSTGVFFSSGDDEPPIERVKIARNHIHHTGVSGINARNFRDVVIERNEIDHVFRYKPGQHTDVIRTFAGGSGLTIRRNYLHDNVGIGVFAKDGPVRSVVLENNLIVRTNGFFAVQLYDVDGLRMVNNTVLDNTGGVLFRRGVRGAVLFNNILDSLNDDGTAEYAYEDYNFIARGTRGARGPHDVGRVPRFVNRESYRLAAGSSAIDAGRVADAPPRDRLGRPRRRGKRSGKTVRPDLGAHEYRPRPKRR
jgi:hypothetical protein